MSEYSENARVAIIMADFANTDAAGKVNIIGGGVELVSSDPATAMTSRFILWADVRIPSAMTPAEFAVEMALIDSMGNLVEAPGPAGPQPLRIAQVVQIERPLPQLPNNQRDHIGARAQMVFDFGNGLPLQPGGNYEWRLMVDGDEDHQLSYPFAVVGPQPGPVFG